MDALLRRAGRRGALLGHRRARPAPGKSTLAAEVVRGGRARRASSCRWTGSTSRRPSSSGSAAPTARARRTRSTPTGSSRCCAGCATRAGGPCTRPSTAATCATPSPGAIAVGPPTCRLVVVEGNYLLLDDARVRAGRRPARRVLVRRRPTTACGSTRLVARHEAFGKSPDAARAWSHGPGRAQRPAGRARPRDARPTSVVRRRPDGPVRDWRREHVPRACRRRPRRRPRQRRGPWPRTPRPPQVMAVVKADALRARPRCRAPAPPLAGGATWLGVAQVDRGPRAARGRDRRRARAHLAVRARRAARRGCVDADVDVSVAAPWALDEVRRRRAGHRSDRRACTSRSTPGLGRNGADARRAARRSCAAVAAAAGRGRRRGRRRLVATSRSPTSPSTRPCTRQAEVFADAVRDASSARGAAPRGAAPGQLRGDADQPRRCTTTWCGPGIAVYGLSPVPQLGGPERLRARPGDDVSRPSSRTVKRVPGGQGVSYAHQYVTPRTPCSGVVPARATPTASRGTRRARGRRPGRARAGGRPARSASPGGCAWTRSCSTSGPDAREQRGRPRRAVRHRRATAGRPRRTGRARPAPSPTRSSRALGARVPAVYVGRRRRRDATRGDRHGRRCADADATRAYGRALAGAAAGRRPRGAHRATSARARRR